MHSGRGHRLLVIIGRYRAQYRHQQGDSYKVSAQREPPSMLVFLFTAQFIASGTAGQITGSCPCSGLNCVMSGSQLLKDIH